MLDRAEDLAFFGLVPHGGGRWTFELTTLLSRPIEGRLFGGTALAVSILLGEVETDRPGLWSTTQFIDGSTAIGDELECRVEVLASGFRTAQVRVRGFQGDREVFCTLGATGKQNPEKPSGAFPERARVLPPDECPPHRFPGVEKMLAEAKVDAKGLERLQELRVAIPTDGYEPPPGQMLLWTRAKGRAITPAVLGYLADVVPMSVTKGLGRAGGGTSIDNTIRLGEVPGDDVWVLCQVEPHLAAGGYGHGVVHLWSEDGRLLGTGSQTAVLLLFD